MIAVTTPVVKGFRAEREVVVEVPLSCGVRRICEPGCRPVGRALSGGWASRRVEALVEWNGLSGLVTVEPWPVPVAGPVERVARWRGSSGRVVGCGAVRRGADHGRSRPRPLP